MANEIAERVVAKYLALKEPGYALMLDAPWDSGKTHFIGKVTGHETDETRLYVSLFNVHTAEEFEWALVRALKPWSEQTEKWGKRISEFVSGVKVAGCSVDLTKVNMTEIALGNLPDTLIFDDVERCGIEPKQLWGLINGFVEHEGKRVILVCNSVKGAKKKQLAAIREKLVGQVVTIEPDIDGALAAVWVRLPDGAGKEFLQKRQGLIRETFADAKHNNLRLLLRALRDAADLIDQIEPDMRAFEDPLERLVRTFLALHMAFHEGRILKEDLVSRGEVATFVPLTDGDENHPLRELAKDQPKAEINAVYNTVFSARLGRKLIGDGYASGEVINEALRKTHQFRETEAKPDWVRLWGWVDEDEAELIALEGRIAQRMQRFEIVEPGEILQLYGAREFKEKYFDDFCPKENARACWNYIQELGRRDLLPARLPAVTRDREAYGFDAEFGRISYGGYAFEPDLRARLLVKLLKQKMDAAFERALPDAAAQLFEDLQNDPLKFREQLEPQAGVLNYCYAAILHQLDVAEIAEVLLRYFREARDVALLVFDTIGNRTSPHRQGLTEEQGWIAALKQELERQAGDVSGICQAQMRLFIRRHMTAQ